MYKTFSLLLLMCLLNCCKTTENSESASVPCSKVVLVDNDLYANASKDPFIIDAVRLEEDCIYISIEYGGGCGEISYDLLASEEVMESFPVQRNLRLSFKDDDNCKALVIEELSFDLVSARPAGEGEVIFRLEGWTERLSYKY